MMAEITNRPALALLEDLEERRHANEELAQKYAATDIVSVAVFANHEEAYRFAIRLVVAALPRIIDDAREQDQYGSIGGGDGWSSDEYGSIPQPPEVAR